MDRERLNQYAQPIVDLYNQIEYDLLGNIAKFIGQDRDMLDNDPEKWEMKMMQSLGMLEQENIKMLRSRYGFKSSQINKAIIQAGLEGTQDNEAFFKEATKKGAKLLTPDPPDKDPTILTILEAFIAQAKKALNLTNSTLLDHAKQIYTDIVNRSTMEVSMGLKTGQQALRQTIRQWANEGIPALVRSDGAKLGPEGYVRTLMVTTTNNAVNAAQDERMKQHGVDLFEVTSHLGARPKCAPFQGTIISLSGNHPDYLSLAQTSFGQPDGLFGINCGHSKYPFIEGISEQRYFPYDTSKNEKAYKESQQQRYLERSIRKAKTQERMFRESGDEEAAVKAKQLVKARQKRMREFIKATDRRRRPDREQIVTGKEAPPAPMPKPKKPRKDPDPPKPDNEPDPTPVPKELPPLKQIQLDMIQRRNRMSKSALEAGDVEDMDKAQAAIEGLENGYFDEAPLIVGPGKDGNWDVFRTERDPDTGRFKFQEDPNAPDDHSFIKSLNNHFDDDKDKDKDKPKPEPKADPEPKRDPEPEPKKEPPKPDPEPAKPDPKPSPVQTFSKAQQAKISELKQFAGYRKNDIKDPKQKARLEQLLASDEFDKNPVYVHANDDGTAEVLDLEIINGMFVAHKPSDNPNDNPALAKKLLANVKAGDKADGILVRLMPAGDGAGASYQGASDRMTIPAYFDKDPKYRKEDETYFIRTFYHELGHRVHQVDHKEMADIDMQEAAGNLAHIDEKDWKRWKRLIEIYWDPNHTTVDKEVQGRMDYPINAKHHYAGGKKIHFQMEMFAEASSYYLENDKDEMAKLEKHYPGLLEYMETIYGLGYWKDTSLSDAKKKREKDRLDKLAAPKKRKTPEEKAMDNFKKELDKKQIQNIIDASNRPFSQNAHIMVELKKTIANMSKGKFIPKFEESDAYGYCSMSAFGNRTIISEYVLKSDDPRGVVYRIKTMFHEYYHAKMDGLDFSGRRKTGNDWTGWEETFTESASHAMLREAGITKEIGFSYSHHLVRNLPKLKTLPEFQDCKTIEDFGRVAMKYRFGTDKQNTLDWSEFQNKLGSGHLVDWKEYVRDNYKEYARTHKDEIKAIIKELNPGISDTQLSASYNRGWINLEDTQGPAFSQSLAIIMNRIGVK